MASSLGRRALPAAELGEELPLGGCETLDAGCTDLVQHAVDFSAGARIRFATRFGALRRRWNAAAAAHAWRLTHQHARFRHLPEPSLAARCPPVLPLEIEQRRRHAAEMREMGDAVVQAGLAECAQPCQHKVHADQERREPLRRNGIRKREDEYGMVRPIPGERDRDAENRARGAEDETD